MGRLVRMAACAALCCACSDGGDGGGGGGGSGGGNAPPVFTSSASASAPDGVAGAFYTAAATDADGDPLTFSIAGGADAGDFTIDATSGALSFVSPPDFDAPSDSNGDNVYEVTLGVSDGAASATLALTVTVTGASNSSIQVRRVGTGFIEPIFLTGLTDGSGRVYVVERGGAILILDPETGDVAAQPFIDLSTEISTTGEGGLLGFALAPDFASSGEVYVNLTSADGGFHTEIRRYDTTSPVLADFDSGDVILAFDQPATNHNGGWIGFGPDGMLYIPTGDGGGSGDPDGNAQDMSSPLGKVLRIDVGGDDFPDDDERDYAIPDDNPFPAGDVPEIWALGLRNPFRGSFDSDTGDLFLGDVGQSAIEEIDRLRPGDGGANLGWDYFEGTEDFEGPPPEGFEHFEPVAQYGRSAGRTVIGGVVYRGAIAELEGEYIFADWISGNVWSVPESSLVPGTTLEVGSFTVRNDDFEPDLGSIDQPVSFGTDALNELYIVDFDGEIFRIEEN